jgi:hypothetical protein
MELLSRDKAIMSLGTKLTKELGLDEGLDTLSRWMAHYIAELIQDAENADGDEKSAKLDRCIDAILALWRHRYELPHGKRPFDDIEPILRTLESLDPENDMPMHFRSIGLQNTRIAEDDPAQYWLKVIEGLDYSSKILIKYCLTKAAEKTLKRSEEWVELAEAAGIEECVDSIVIRLIADENDFLKDSDVDDSARKRLQDLVTRLEGIQNLTTILCTELHQKIQELIT